MTDRLRLPEVVASLEGTPAGLSALLRGLPREMLAWHPPGSGRWCIKEVVGHLTETDRHDFVDRIRLMLDHDDPLLTVSDQVEVARLRHDCDRDLDALLDEFRLQRAASLSYVAGLGSEELRRGGTHPKIGHLQIENLLHEWIYHDMNHIRQVVVNAQGFLWNHLGNMQRFYQP